MFGHYLNIQQKTLDYFGWPSLTFFVFRVLKISASSFRQCRKRSKYQQTWSMLYCCFLLQFSIFPCSDSNILVPLGFTNDHNKSNRLIFLQPSSLAGETRQVVRFNTVQIIASILGPEYFCHWSLGILATAKTTIFIASSITIMDIRNNDAFFSAIFEPCWWNQTSFTVHQNTNSRKFFRTKKFSYIYSWRSWWQQIIYVA